jgi:hypothetical protein
MNNSAHTSTRKLGEASTSRHTSSESSKGAQSLVPDVLVAPHG